MLKPVTVSFEQGLHQIFKQPSGTGIDFSAFYKEELTKENDTGVFPLVIKAEVCLSKNDGSEDSPISNSLISLAVFGKKENGEYLVRVVKQILWADGEMYELKEIYGIGNSVDVESDENDIGKECVICLRKQRDTAVLPCRHMCMCGGCAQVLQFHSKRYPICRQPVEGLQKIKVNDETSG
ncbi:hypothetical protein Tsubulata_048026 [Turnera subulata]|uniref:RING-type E3 ubiquitin transferase n=1 Tax=Turnera subulata TaxID=218843 RepID=A0A9Q0JA84_9ROSI|nr:hypothetical protein Tsubulata_048026 [Turnera subulata]